MNTTDTAATAAKATTAPAAQPKPGKPQRRMARPAQNDAETNASPAAIFPTTQSAPKPETGAKTTTVIALLEREQGATLAELIAATGWLPHTTRAALTGLRKKGHVIERSKRGEETCLPTIRTNTPIGWCSPSRPEMGR